MLLAEEKKYDEAVLYLAKAAKGMPKHARVHYNLGLLLDYLQKDREAEKALLEALEIEPSNRDFLVAAAEFYLKRKRFKEAKQIAKQLLSSHPSNRIGQRILNSIDQNTKGSE